MCVYTCVSQGQEPSYWPKDLKANDVDPDQAIKLTEDAHLSTNASCPKWPDDMPVMSLPISHSGRCLCAKVGGHHKLKVWSELTLLFSISNFEMKRSGKGHATLEEDPAIRGFTCKKSAMSFQPCDATYHAAATHGMSWPGFILVNATAKASRSQLHVACHGS